MTGSQVAESARRLRPDSKVLFITGYTEAAVLGDGMQVLPKPFAMGDLAARITGLLAAPARAL